MLQKILFRNLEKIRSGEKMDKEACWNASEGDLVLLGLTSKEDKIKLKSFSMPGDEDEHQLAETLKSTASERTLSAKRKDKCNQRKGKTIHLGWMHYNKHTAKYVAVRKTRGGGSHPFYFGKRETLKDIMDEAKWKFFPNGKSCVGDLHSMEFGIGNRDGMEDIDFNTTVETYVLQGSKKTRMYMLTAGLRSSNFLKKYAASTNFEESDDEDDFQITFNSIPGAVYNPMHISDDDQSNTQEPSQEPSHLIGTTEERNELLRSIQNNYEESLNKDRQKECERNRLQLLMEERRMRVIEGPNLSDSHVTITIRHPSLDTKIRLFHADCHFTQVYDWVGSLSTEPEYFELRGYDNKMINPSDIVYSGVFYVYIVSDPVFMSPNGTVSFKVAVNEIPTDNSTVITQKHVAEEYDALKQLRDHAFKSFEGKELTMEISRTGVYTELLSLYSKRVPISTYLKPSFSKEDS